MSKRQEAELEAAELKMLRLSPGVTSMDRIRNESMHHKHLISTSVIAITGFHCSVNKSHFKGT